MDKSTPKRASHPFKIGDTIRLKSTAPKTPSYRMFSGLSGEVTAIYPQAVTVRFTVPGEIVSAVCTCDIAVAYIEKVAAERRAAPRNEPAPIDPRSEQDKQREVIDFLVDAGYIVLAAGQYMRKTVCKKCGEVSWPGGGYGNAVGIPDLLITHDRWHKRGWTVIEMKKQEDSPRGEKQIDLASRDRSIFCWSLMMAVDAIIEFEEGIGVLPLPLLVAYKKGND